MEKEQSQLLHSKLLLLVINMPETKFLFRLDPVYQTVIAEVDPVGHESHDVNRVGSRERSSHMDGQ